MKIICIGRNYIDHAKELNNPVPAKPVFFLKPDSALVIRNRPFYYPEFSNDVHHELEVVIKINRLGKSIEEQFADRYFAEIGLGIDFTARDLQTEAKQKGLPWELAKGFDYSAPISRFIPVSKFDDIHHLRFHLLVNGTKVQDGNTADMIFSYEKLISYVSKFMTLKTGDLIYTGTPAGVGPVKPGDHLEAWLEDIKLLDFHVK